MRIYDISMPIHEGMPVWKDKEEKRPDLTIIRDYENGQGGRETRLALDMHTGTHIDAPLHFVFQGATMESIPLTTLVRPVRVLDLTHVRGSIGVDDLAPFSIQGGEFVLLKTSNSFAEGWDSDFVFVDGTGAEHLASRGVAGVGIDALGIERSQPDHETHRQLLGASVVIIEGLRLKSVEPGEYFMVAAPLRVPDVEAAPARVLLLSGFDSGTL